MPEKVVVIVAGGTGTRMKSDMPKQFLELNGLPIIIHTIQKFLDYNPKIDVIVVVHKDYLDYLRSLLSQHLPAANIRITEGGATRFDSVHRGLSLITNSEALVAIHDAARPLVSTQTIRTCFDEASSVGNAVPVIALTESLRQFTDHGNKAVDREAYKIVQTPQCFRFTEIFAAFANGFQSTFTDDATVLEASGKKINLVPGNPENIKITNPQDLHLASFLLDRKDQ